VGVVVAIKKEVCRCDKYITLVTYDSGQQEWLHTNKDGLVQREYCADGGRPRPKPITYASVKARWDAADGE
jgi:hypothetical protein